MRDAVVRHTVHPNATAGVFVLLPNGRRHRTLLRRDSLRRLSATAGCLPAPVFTPFGTTTRALRARRRRSFRHYLLGCALAVLLTAKAAFL